MTQLPILHQAHVELPNSTQVFIGIPLFSGVHVILVCADVSTERNFLTKRLIVALMHMHGRIV